MDYTGKEDLVEYLFEKIKCFMQSSESNNFRTKFLQSKILLYCVVLILVLKIAIVSISINFPQNIFFADITKATLENFANQTRKAAGLQALTENAKLTKAAELKAKNMVQNQYFAHTSPTGITPWYWFSQAGYNYKYAGENLAIGFFESEEVYNAWLNSPSHKANIVNPNYKEVGTAVLNGYGANNTIVVVQEFGSQQLTIAKKAAEKSNNPAVAPKPNTEAQEARVLSQSTENGSSNVYYKIASSVAYDYDEWLQNIIYGIGFVVIGVLLSMILLNNNFGQKRELVFRSALIVVLLSLATVINKDVIISIIPHQIFI